MNLPFSEIAQDIEKIFGGKSPSPEDILGSLKEMRKY